MFDIHVERIIDKDIESVFEILADHTAYARFRGVNGAKLLEPGHTEKNGEGALRYIDLGAIKFAERITCFERPYRLDYKIEKSSPLPFNHDTGSITLSEVEGGTKVTWISRGSINIPVLGKLFLGPLFERKGRRGFGSLLKQISAL
ncbi:SRPBCC family protein [Microbulbifer agarilyticus]|uniref:SRPBCC family protein n=1 Tax=Microbulbifer agarilyticus TaxID=260552 RepID=UPI001CD7426E|nr:SRPBCC family protein [Microbulbifer agarilyticus]MCA0893261.1 SRPBCC family protein [Microbulbifer agarilyticus]